MSSGELPLSDFSVAATFLGDEVILAVGGEVDALTAPEFDAFFETMIARGHRRIVLDLAHLRFMDASGLSVIAHGATRLEVLGGSLTIRTPAVLIRQMLDITGFARLVRLDLHESDYGLGRLGAEQGEPSVDDVVLQGVSYGITRGLRRFTAIHSDDEAIDGALQLAVALVRSVVDSADGVSVSLRRRGQLSTVAATDQTISNMDANQYETGQGPCVAASTEGHWFHAESMESETRWPAFTPRALALGIQAILSTPLMVNDSPVGALNIYSLTPSAFSLRDQEVAAAFAAETSSILTEADIDLSQDQLSLRFQEALRAREVIAQAQGVLMERDGIGEHDAYSALRRYSLESGRPLQERAEYIVSTTRQSRPDSESGQPADDHG